MKRKGLRRILMILLALIFFACGGVVLAVRYKYIANDRLNRSTINNYTTKRSASSSAAFPASSSGSSDVSGSDGEEQRERVYAPIEVDFKELKELNDEIIGWIYCEDTPINFPVVQADDNDFYIDHSYDRRANPCGAAFADAYNTRDFGDSNTIIYGHHLINGAAFASLEKWLDQEFFDEHPIMWILTPEQDYRVELFSAYYVSAFGDAYTLFRYPTAELGEYLAAAMDRAEASADVELDVEAKYVMLSTCAYVFDYARAVLHGKMVPIDSAGGVPIE